LTRWRRIGIGGRGIVAAESFDLGTDDALRGGHIVSGAGRGSEADQERDEQDEGVHEDVPWLRFRPALQCFESYTRVGASANVAGGILPAISQCY